jgi:hypothetical protein
MSLGAPLRKRRGVSSLQNCAFLGLVSRHFKGLVAPPVLTKRGMAPSLERLVACQFQGLVGPPVYGLVPTVD